MTKKEWLLYSEPEAMLDRLLSTGQASDRKLRLFAVGCCRRIWHVLEYGKGREVIEVADRFADGRASLDSLQAAHNQMEQEAEEWDRWVPYESADIENAEAAWAAWITTGLIPSPRFLKVVEHAANAAVGGGRRLALPTEFHSGEPLKAEIQRGLTIEAQAQCSLVRDIFGTALTDPKIEAHALRPPLKLDVPWLTSDVILLAEGIYTGQAFDRMPILGDALEEAGCDDPVILGHCRGAGPHVRGCWVRGHRSRERVDRRLFRPTAPDTRMVGHTRVFDQPTSKVLGSASPAHHGQKLVQLTLRTDWRPNAGDGQIGLVEPSGRLLRTFPRPEPHSGRPIDREYSPERHTQSGVDHVPAVRLGELQIAFGVMRVRFVATLEHPLEGKGAINQPKRQAFPCGDPAKTAEEQFPTLGEPLFVQRVVHVQALRRLTIDLALLAQPCTFQFWMYQYFSTFTQVIVFFLSIGSFNS